MERNMQYALSMVVNQDRRVIIRSSIRLPVGAVARFIVNSNYTQIQLQVTQNYVLQKVLGDLPCASICLISSPCLISGSLRVTSSQVDSILFCEFIFQVKS